MQAFAAQLDDIGKPAWIALTVVSFILFWPLGLFVLGFLLGSGRMACWTHGGTDRRQRRMDRMQKRMQRMQSAAERWGCGSYRDLVNRLRRIVLGILALRLLIGEDDARSC